MITLITGTPGSGKTAWTVQELTRLPAQRKIYVHGIPNLKIAHEPIYCTSDLCEHCRSTTEVVDGYLDEIANPGRHALLVEEWQDWANEGSLIVLDEVQRVWRPSGSKLPDEIAALETHRHKGLDFWIISQGPHLFHSNIRLLIGRHIHLVSTWKGRNEYEFPECRQNVSARSDAVIRPYSLPKKVFALYKSASLHTVAKHRKPLSFYFLIATLIFAAILGIYTYKRFSDKLKPVDDTQGGGAKAQAIATPPPPSLQNEIKRLAFPDFKPVVENLNESAPAYAHLIKVTAAPLLMGCVKTPDFCRCYTTQGSPYPTSALFCEEYLKGNYFNPYKKDKEDDQLVEVTQLNKNN
jgi:zona occludens toxin